uniref:Uncharacterized protein n=1 Tax=Plectus sambesii TaxID=2011161 RepID=A0A914V6N8_9BILA
MSLSAKESPLNAELDLLAAVYCRPNEFHQLTPSIFSLQLTPLTKLIVDTGSGNADSASLLSISSTETSREDSESFKKLLEKKVEELKRQREHDEEPIWYDLCSFAVESFAERLTCAKNDTTNDQKNAAKVNQDKLKRIILLFDHMRDRSGYLRKLEEMCDSLSIFGQVYFLGREIRSCLEGSCSHITEFLRLLRTTCMDVDSMGRPCKERMMQILHESEVDERTFDSFTVLDGLSPADFLAHLGSLCIDPELFCLNTRSHAL